MAGLGKDLNVNRIEKILLTVELEHPIKSIKFPVECKGCYVILTLSFISESGYPSEQKVNLEIFIKLLDPQHLY